MLMKQIIRSTNFFELPLICRLLFFLVVENDKPYHLCSYRIARTFLSFFRNYLFFSRQILNTVNSKERDLFTKILTHAPAHIDPTRKTF